MVQAAPFRRPARHRQRGITFVEVTVVLAIAGLLSWAAFGAYDTMNDQRARQEAQSLTLEMQSHLRSFAVRNGRLPCPDASVAGTGYESLTGGACGGGNQVGWFPYVSLGLVLPVDGLRARYAVFRAANATAVLDADLTAARERTGDAVQDVRYQDVTDLIVALNNMGSVTFSSARAYLTGDGGPAGAISCAANSLMPVAYWITVPLEDRDGDGARLDTPHSAASTCASSPSAPVRADSDDVVLSESPAQLAGWLRNSLP